MTQSEFLIDVRSWNDHLPLMWLALEETKDSKMPVIEFGSGGGSTPYLRKYCQDNNREFISYDYDKDWAERTGAIHVKDWGKSDIYKPCSVLLVDESPGEHRHESMLIMKDRVDILVIHDTESIATGYMLYKAFPFFKYRIDCRGEEIGAEASAVSNKIDITKWDGIELVGFKISK